MNKMTFDLACVSCFPSDMRRLVVLAAASLALLAMPVTAFGRSAALRYFGVGHGPAVGDGRNELALLDTHDALQVFVWRSGIASVSVHPRPRCGNEGSRPQPFTFPAQTVGAIHDGTVAWSCTYPPNLILQNLATGELDEPADWRTFVDAGGGPDSFEVTGLGDDWARIIRSGYHYTDEEGYVNVMTGAVAFLNRPRQYADLNRPHVVRQLCAPLTRSENDGAYGDVPSFQPYASERPYGATVVLGAGTSERETLVLERCGSRRKRVLDRCPQRCSSVQLNGGVLTWLSGTRARAYVLRTSRSYRWSLPIAGDQAGATVIHLRTRMLASIPPHAGGSDWTYWSAFFRPVAVRRGSP